jgi:hypothetical protein
MWDTTYSNFPYKPPLIGPDDYWDDGTLIDWTGNSATSVYYWWWQYLKRNVDYIQTCNEGGSGPCSKLYLDFGDVRGDHFATWWRAKGKYLFAEPDKKYEFKRVTEPLLEEAYSDKSVMIVQVPLGEPATATFRRFKRLFAQANHEYERSNPNFSRPLTEGEKEGVRNSGEWGAYVEDLMDVMEVQSPPKFKQGIRAARSSKARYPVVGQPNVNALKQTLLVYDYRVTNAEKTLWQVAVATIATWKNFNPRGINAAEDKNQMNVEVSRYLKKAKSMIYNVGLGRFPDIHKYPAT